MNLPTHATPRPRVIANIIDGPLTREREEAVLASHDWTPARRAAMHDVPSPAGLVGAAIRFEGIVRRKEPHAGPQEVGGGAVACPAGEHDLLALDYQTYDPMAERGLLALSREVVERHGLLSIAALHSRGRVGVGEVSFVLIVESAHRAEGLKAMTDFIDRLKKDVPIWKRAVWR